MTKTLANWRKACTPHRDIQENAVSEAGSAWEVVNGYVGQSEVLPPDTRSIRLRGTVNPMGMANVIKTAMGLSNLGDESSITLDLQLKGEVNDHSVQMACYARREIGKRVVGLVVEDVRGKTQ